MPTSMATATYNRDARCPPAAASSGAQTSDVQAGEEHIDEGGVAGADRVHVRSDGFESHSSL